MASTDIVFMTSPNRGCVAQHDNPIQHAVEKIREVLKSQTRDTSEELSIIDTIQRLGLDYYIRDEIREILERQYNADWKENYGDDDLNVTALRFRLIRQQGYIVYPDAFKKFQGNDGKFQEELGKDIKGLLSLYENCQLSIPREDILDEAIEFSSRFLRASLLDKPEQPKALLIGQPQAA